MYAVDKLDYTTVLSLLEQGADIDADTKLLERIEIREQFDPQTKEALEEIRERYLSTLGLKWKNVGTNKPTRGKELVNRELSKALRKKLEFTEKEFEDFEVENLSTSHYILADREYFKPVVLKSQGYTPASVLAPYPGSHISMFNAQSYDHLQYPPGTTPKVSSTTPKVSSTPPKGG